MSAFTVEEVSVREELDGIADCIWEVMEHNDSAHKVFYPVLHDRETALSECKERLWNEHINDPSSHWIFVRDGSSDSLKVLGACQWRFYEQNPFPYGMPDVKATWWPEGGARDLASEFARKCLSPRAAWMSRPHTGVSSLVPLSLGCSIGKVSSAHTLDTGLSWCVVLPTHQKRGIGQALMAWGLRKTDELGLESYIEATPAGRKLYERCGFCFVARVDIDVHDKDCDEGWKDLQSLVLPTGFNASSVKLEELSADPEPFSAPQVELWGSAARLKSTSPQLSTKNTPLVLDKEIEATPYPEVHDGKGTTDGKSADSKSSDSQVSSVEEHQQPRSIDRNVDVEKGLEFDLPASGEGPNGAASPLRNGEYAKTQDKNVVWWEEPADQDPANPLNWSAKKKWANIAILSGITLVTPLASSIFAPVVPDVMVEFHSNSEILATFVVSVYLLGFAFGPLIIGPLSEIYGRILLYNISNVFFIGFTIGCALSTSLNMLFAFRVLAGLAGCTVLTIGGGTIADIFPQEKRGGAMAIWSLGPLIGPIIGPVAGGYLGQAKGWRWVFWLLVMLAGFFDILCLIFCRETYAPVLLQRKTLRLQKETGNLELRSKLDTGLTPSDLFKRSIFRPTKLLFFSPICTVLCVYTAIVYGILYLLYTTFTYVFEGQYGFSPGTVGLTYIGLGIGMILGMAIFGGASDRILKAKSKTGEMKPEYRLPPLVPGSFCVPIGLFIYGWTAKYHEQWAVPLLGTLIVGLGLLAVFVCQSHVTLAKISIANNLRRWPFRRT
ncbi:MAG: hypothetical protein Q9165_004789 [Trypethelium subeluteriae]